MKDQKFKSIAKSIREKLESSEKVLLTLHRSPDGDSIGSNSAFYEILRQFGKEVTLASPDPIPENLMFVPHADKVVIKDIFEIGFEKPDLVVLLDSSSWHMTSHRANLPPLPSKDKTIIIDHHTTNENMGSINLVLPDLSSTCEIVFYLAKEWEIDFTKDLSQTILTGMATDTGFFHYPNTSPSALRNAASLMENGGSLNLIVLNVLRRNSPLKLKLLGRILNNLLIDKEYAFAYATLSYKDIQEVGNGESTHQVREFTANSFMQSIEGTEFGFVIIEEEKRVSHFSIRARKDFDVSRIALELGGGGHKSAAGARISLPFKKALKKAIEVSRKYSKK